MSLVRWQAPAPRSRNWRERGPERRPATHLPWCERGTRLESRRRRRLRSLAAARSRIATTAASLSSRSPTPARVDFGLSRHRCGQDRRARACIRVTSKTCRRLTLRQAVGPLVARSARSAGPHSPSVPERRPDAISPGSCAFPGRRGRRCAARCARPCRAILDCPAQLRWLAMNVTQGRRAPDANLPSARASITCATSTAL